MAEAAKKKMVKVRLFHDNGRYRRPVYVSVNGETYQIKRGEDVMVPDYIAEALENSQKQDQYALDHMMAMQKDANW